MKRTKGAARPVGRPRKYEGELRKSVSVRLRPHVL